MNYEKYVWALTGVHVFDIAMSLSFLSSLHPYSLHIISLKWVRDSLELWAFQLFFFLVSIMSGDFVFPPSFSLYILLTIIVSLQASNLNVLHQSFSDVMSSTEPTKWILAFFTPYRIWLSRSSLYSFSYTHTHTRTHTHYTIHIHTCHSTTKSLFLT